MGAILAFFSSYFVGLFKGLIGKAAVSLSAAIAQFIHTDLGKLALDGVEYAATLVGKSNTELRDAARQRMIDDAKAAGHDIETLAESQANLFIEMAYTAWKQMQNANDGDPAAA